MMDAATRRLLEAADAGDVAAVKQAIADGAVVHDAVDTRGETALIKAAAHGDVDVVAALLVAHAECDRTTPWGWTALLCAAHHGHAEVARRLVVAGANVDHVSVRGDAPLVSAIRNGHANVVDLLLTAGVNGNAHRPYTTSPLTLATQRNLSDVVHRLLKNGASVNHSDETGDSALLHAARLGHSSVVATLLAAGADVHATTKTTRATALTLACSGGHTNVVALLLAADANVDHTDQFGFSPLMYAVKSADASSEIVTQLLRAGAEVNTKTRHHKETALILAAQKGDVAIVELLVAVQGLEIDSADARGDTALTHAANARHVSVLGVLCPAGANVHHTNAAGQTALTLASRDDDLSAVEMVEILMSASVCDANDSTDDVYANAALVTASRHGSGRVVDILLAWGANVNHVTPDKTTALVVASKHNHKDVVARLLAAGADENATRDSTILLTRDTVTAKRLASD